MSDGDSPRAPLLVVQRKSQESTGLPSYFQVSWTEGVSGHLYLLSRVTTRTLLGDPPIIMLCSGVQN